MVDFFLQLVNLSKTVSIMIITVIVLKFVLNKAPKKVHKLLWLIIGIRSCLPFYIRSSFGILASDSAPTAFSDYGILRTVPVSRPVTPKIAIGSSAAVSTAFGVRDILACIWIAGVLLFAGYMLVSSLRVRRLTASARPVAENIYVSDGIPSPFIAGLLKPKIYILPEMNQNHQVLILAHEQCHLKNKDHIFKFLGFLLLGIYWFNPLMWLAYYLFCKDIELSCDEEVIRSLSFRQRKDYAAALLDSAHTNTVVYGVAFCENSVKERVVNVMNYKKPKFWIIIAAVICVLAVLVVFFTAKQASSRSELVTYEFETYDGTNVKIDESNIISQQTEENVLETAKVPENAEIIAPGRDYVYLADERYYYVEDAAKGLLTVASKGAVPADTKADQYECDHYSFVFDANKLSLFEENAAVTLSFTQEGVETAGSNVMTFSAADGAAEEVMQKKVCAIGGDPAAIGDAVVGDSAKAYVYSQSGESAESGLKTAQTYYAVQGGDCVVFVDQFRTIGADEATEAAIDAAFADVLRSLACK